MKTYKTVNKNGLVWIREIKENKWVKGCSQHVDHEKKLDKEMAILLNGDPNKRVYLTTELGEPHFQCRPIGSDKEWQKSPILWPIMKGHQYRFRYVVEYLGQTEDVINRTNEVLLCEDIIKKNIRGYILDEERDNIVKCMLAYKNHIPESV